MGGGVVGGGVSPSVVMAVVSGRLGLLGRLVGVVCSTDSLVVTAKHVKLELYRAHTPRAHCAIYGSTFVAAWLYQGLIDPTSPWLYNIGLLVIRYQLKHH